MWNDISVKEKVGLSARGLCVGDFRQRDMVNINYLFLL